MIDLAVFGTALLILALLILSGLFSGSETALTAASRATMHRLEADGLWRAAQVNRLIANRERLIGALLVGNNFVNILASALATNIFITYFGDAGVALATVLMTALVLIFSEVLPKTYAISAPERTAMAVAPSIRIVVALFTPIVATVRLIVRGTLGLFGINIDANQEVLSAHEEIRGAIDLHHQAGIVVKHDRDMLGGVLDLGDLVVGDLMIHRKNISTINVGQTSRQVIEEALESGHSRIPAWRGEPDNIVGVLHVKDLMRAMARAENRLDEIEISPLLMKPWFVPDLRPAKEQLAAFLRRRQHFALVVDEYGTLEGIITLEDIIEEIVGAIEDEHDETEIGGIRPQADGTIIVDGTVAIRDINRAFGWSLPDDEATTIAGLVIHEAQMIPEPGQAFIFHKCKFEILKRQRNQIVLLRVSPKSPMVTSAA